MDELVKRCHVNGTCEGLSKRLRELFQSLADEGTLNLAPASMTIGQEKAAELFEYTDGGTGGFLVMNNKRGCAPRLHFMCGQSSASRVRDAIAAAIDDAADKAAREAKADAIARCAHIASGVTWTPSTSLTQLRANIVEAIGVFEKRT
jgi:hypothetical protein